MTKPRWTDAEIALLRDMYPSCHSADVAAWLGRSLAAVHRHAERLSVGKHPEFFHDPVCGRALAGRHPFNWQPLGSHRTSRRHAMRKVRDTGYAPDDWVPVHRLVWEAAQGPVPSGHVIRFKPGQHTTNADAITVDRLQCIPIAENGRRNFSMPAEVRRLVQLKSAITKHVRRIEQAAQERA